MCRFEVDIEKISNRLNINPASLQVSIKALHPLREDDLIEIDGGRIKLSPDRRAFVRLVAPPRSTPIYRVATHAILRRYDERIYSAAISMALGAGIGT